MNTLTFPRPVFHHMLRALAQGGRASAFVRVGVRAEPGGREWLARDFSLAPGALDLRREQVFRVALAAEPPHATTGMLGQDAAGALYVGDGAWRGHVWGHVRAGDGCAPLDALALAGAGMHAVPVLNIETAPAPAPPAAVPLNEYWSRTIGALGGMATWQRLIRLRVAVIGCGRTGSLAAVTLARAGIDQLTLIDPDVVEPHNLGEMDGVTAQDIGRPKAEALAAHLRAQLTHFPVSAAPLVASIADGPALAAAKACDVLFCCTDDDAARLAAALLATLYHKVLIDAGTGIFYHAEESDVRRVMGADVRLVVPGDGCLLCRGGLADYARALDDLCHHRAPAGPADWSQGRAGSLRTLNQLAVALGVQMLQDLVSERLPGSIWARAEFDDAGRLAVRYPPPVPGASAACALCARAGLGDGGW